MDILKWKKVKRSGNYRRKVKQKLDHLLLLSQSGRQLETNSERKTEPIYSEDVDFNNSAKTTSVKEECPADNNTYSKNTAMVTMIDYAQEFNNNWIVEMEPDDEDDVSSVNLLSEDEQNLRVRSRIRTWATSYRINQMALKELINIWNERLPHLFPEDPRTLLKTPRTVVLKDLGNNGSYWHHGLSICLKKYLLNEEIIPQSISLNINIDGLPVYKSSKQEFWPILCNICELPHIKPMIIGIFSGFGKPNDVKDFLSPFVDEMNLIIKNGIHIYDSNGERTISVKIRCFICDSPARAFIKGVTNFNGKHGCLKCTTVGEYSYISHCIFFPRSNCPKRTDQGFRLKEYSSHFKTDTPLVQLPVDMIEDFPVADSLHLIDLGIMKRCLLGWRDGNFGSYKTKWPARDTFAVTKFLLRCKMPSEIHRAVRGLDSLAHWKGLEYRTFFYYIGIVALKTVLPNDAYEHFLLLFCAITICSSNTYFPLLDLAETLINHYVETFRDFYGEDYMTSNVHNLTHVVDEVRKFGELSSFNAYPFESKLFQIKNLLRNGNRPLAQVAKRLQELTEVETEYKKKITKTYPILKQKSGNVYSKLEFENFLLSSETKDKWFLTHNNQIIQMHNAIQHNDEILFQGSSLKNLNDYFNTPIKSSYLNIYRSNELDINASDLYSSADIKCKLVNIVTDTETVFIPLLHTL